MKSLDIKAHVDIPDLSQNLAQVEKALLAAAVPKGGPMREAIQRLIGVKSKRLRSIMVLAAAASSTKANQKKAQAGCVAVELVHLGTLVHDDIIDNATTRRGQPTIHNKEGMNQAIVAGDYLLAIACREAAKLGGDAGILVADTIATLCEGESQELAEEYILTRSVATYLEVIADKTASLFSASCQIGGIAGGLSAEKITALGQYGHHFGIMFQLVDDMLDFISTAEILGKPQGGDVREGVYTMPLLLALEGPRRETICTWLMQPHIPPRELTEMLVRENTFQRTLHMATTHARRATSILAEAGISSPALADFPDVYMQQALTHLVAPEYKSILPQ